MPRKITRDEVSSHAGMEFHSHFEEPRKGGGSPRVSGYVEVNLDWPDKDGDIELYIDRGGELTSAWIPFESLERFVLAARAHRDGRPEPMVRCGQTDGGGLDGYHPVHGSPDGPWCDGRPARRRGDA